MINNKVILDLDSKGVAQKKSGISDMAIVPKEKNTIDNDFKKILNENSQRYNNKSLEPKIHNRLDNKKNNKSDGNLDSKIKNNETESVHKSTLEKVVEKAVEIINDEENFQGNKLEDVAIEEIIALLNQILNSPQFESLLPVKLEDPMYVTGSNIEVKGNDLSKEALDLINTIVETLNSKNVNEFISSDKVDSIKDALEALSENLLNKISDLTESVSEKGLGKNDLIQDLKDIKTNSKDLDSPVDITSDSSEEEIQNIITELKSNLSSDKNANDNMGKYGVTSEVNVEENTEEDKILAKILGEDESIALNKQSNFINRLNVKSTEVIKEPMVVSKETMDADIIKNVKFMIKNSVSELNVKIYPKELGEMTIKLLSEEGILKADIRATSKETYNLLHSNLNEIKKSLEQQNIKIHEVNIGLYSEDTTYHSGEQAKDEMFKNNENKQGRNSSRESGDLLENLEEEGNLYYDSSVDILA